MEDITLEDGELVNFKKLKKIATSGIEKCICKIVFEKEGELKCGTGFFCHIPKKKLKVLITNNHVINEDFLNEKKILEIEVEEEIKKINLELYRFKMTNIEIDFTIIELLKEDNIQNYLEIDENIFLNDYKNNLVFSAQHPGGDDLNYSHGKIIQKKNNLFLYSLGSKAGSSGSPIILFNNLKVIWLHKGCSYVEKNNKINIGIPINLIIEKIN